MSPLLLTLLFVHLFQCNDCVPVKSGEAINADVEERIDDMTSMIEALAKKMAKLENSLETKSVEVSHLQTKIRELEAQKRSRDFPYEMVCALKEQWIGEPSQEVINFDRITSELNNSDQPGGLFVQIYSHTMA